MAGYIPRTLTYLDDKGERRAVRDDEIGAWRAPEVVLAEPGMGKTRLLEKLAHQLGYEFITARAFLRRSSEQLRGLARNGALVIDALDEVASARSEDPVHQVLSQLAECGAPRFILSCRAADWRGAIARHDIASDYGEAPREYRLEPLTIEDAMSYLGAQVGPEYATRIVDDLRQKSLEPFFGNPLTLTLIGRLTAVHGDLPKSRAELYRQACDLLWLEHDPLRGRSDLANLNPDLALDAAGAACASLVLTGSECVSFEAPGHVISSDLHVAEIEGLPGAETVQTILRSGLFLRAEGGDRLKPFHRAIAEYLGARWLSRKLPPDGKRRLMALLTFSGGVPASLRGIHAWLSHFSHELSAEVIRADPYGVLRYGDAEDLRPSDCQNLFAALRDLANEDPYFRSEDWGRHPAPALAHPSLLPEIEGLLKDRNAEYQFRLIVLEALNGAALVPTLERQLIRIVLNDGDQALTFIERRAASEALLGPTGPRLDWNATVGELSRSADEDSRRLAVELISAAPESITTSTVVTSLLAYLGLLPDVAVGKAVDTVGPLYFLARAIPAIRIAEVLDALAAIPLSRREMDWEVRYALGDFISTLTAKELERSAIDPIRLFRWLEIGSFREGRAREHRKEIGQFLLDHTVTRRAIQRHVLLIRAGDDGPWARAWELQEVDQALYPSVEDVASLLGDPELANTADPQTREKWKEVLQLGARQEGLPAEVQSAAIATAKGDPELLERINALAAPRIPEWQIRQDRQDAARARAREKLWAKHRASFLERDAEIRRGDLGAILPLSQAYFRQFNDIEKDESPRHRLTSWVGEDVLAAALEGFEATLHRHDLPSSEDVANSYAHSQRWNFVFPILAGLRERAVTGQGFSDLSEDVVLIGRIGLLCEFLDEDSGGKALEEPLDSYLSTRPELFERYVRLLIEPQLANPSSKHISGLYQLARQQEFRTLIDDLAAEWLRRFPQMSTEALLELVDRLIRSKRRADLREIASARVNTEADLERKLTWHALLFITDFEETKAELTQVARQDANFLWHLRNRGFGGDEFDVDPQLRLDQLAWIVREFRGRYPEVDRPKSAWSGNQNAWDAADFVRSAIRRIASDTSDAAIETLGQLSSEGNDSYADALRKARADQRKARREADFRPPTLQQVASVLAEASPRSALDLQAVALRELERVQRQLRGDDVGTVSIFYDRDEPLSENGCRDSLAILLRGHLPFGIELVPERQMPGNTRADFVLQLGEFQLPVEAKGQWNRELWTAAELQLDALYSKDWRASATGLYLVFWFGPNVSPSKRLKVPRGAPRPQTPDELASAITRQIPQHRRSDLAVFVLDASR